MICKQIGVNLPKDGWSSLLLHLLMDDHHLGCQKKRFISKNNAWDAHHLQQTTSQNWKR
jgi:hypothetical protein